MSSVRWARSANAIRLAKAVSPEDSKRKPDRFLPTSSAATMRPSVVVSGCWKATDGVLCTCRGKPAQPANSIAAVSRSNRELRIQPSYQADFAAMHTQRRIRSFVLRAGRTTPAQERALSELWPAYGIDLNA